MKLKIDFNNPIEPPVYFNQYEVHQRTMSGDADAYETTIFRFQTQDEVIDFLEFVEWIKINWYNHEFMENPRRALRVKLGMKPDGWKGEDHNWFEFIDSWPWDVTYSEYLQAADSTEIFYYGPGGNKFSVEVDKA